MYTALGSIAPPGSLVYGYHRGDQVDDSVVENWKLVVGQDVVEGPLPTDTSGETEVPVMRPSVEEGSRADWEAYAVANGMEQEKAAEVSIEELQEVEPQEQEAADETGGGEGGAVQPETPSGEAPVPAPTDDRPADSANKAEWVAYVSEHGSAEDKAWASASGTTKADLQAWQPTAADPVAVSATERNND